MKDNEHFAGRLMTARRFTRLCQLILPLAIVACGVYNAMSGFKLVEAPLPASGCAYLTTLLAFAAFPNRRRIDLAFMTAALLGGSQAIVVCLTAAAPSMMLSSPCLYGYLLSVTAVVVATAPGELDNLRSACRRHKWLDLSNALAMHEQPRCRAQRSRAGQVRVTPEGQAPGSVAASGLGSGLRHR